MGDILVNVWGTSLSRLNSLSFKDFQKLSNACQRLQIKAFNFKLFTKNLALSVGAAPLLVLSKLVV